MILTLQPLQLVYLYMFLVRPSSHPSTREQVGLFAHVLAEVVCNEFHEKHLLSFAIKLIRDLLVFQKRRARSNDRYGQ